MLSVIEIRHLRGIRKGEIRDLTPLSILVGPNNSGKSTCLEAMAMLGFGTSIDVAARLFLRRGGPIVDAVSRVATGRAERPLSKTATLDASDSEGQQLRYGLEIGEAWRMDRIGEAREAGFTDPVIEVDVLVDAGRGESEAHTFVDATGRILPARVKYDPIAPWPTAFVDVEAVRAVGALENAYSALEKAGRVGQVVSALRKSEKDLTDLKILKEGEDFLLHTMSERRRPVPAYLAGDGFKRLLTVSAAVLGVENGLVLLEEPESFQHPRYLRELAAILREAVSTGTQVILSTHSIELVDLLLQDSVLATGKSVTVHRLRLMDGELRATRLGTETAITAREDLFEDLRT